MRIGIDCRTILDERAPNKAGVAHYTYYLVKALLEIDKKNQYVLFFDERATSLEVGDLRAEIHFFHFSRYKQFLPYVYSHILIAYQIRGANLDIYHSPANIIPMSLFWQKNRPKLVVTIHDLAIYHHPEWFPPRQGFSIKYLVPQTVKRVDKIIVPSTATKQDIVRLFKVSEQKIAVIPHGVEARFFKSGDFKPATSYQLPATSPYILFVGTLEPRKNLRRLIQAYAALPEDILAKYDLVIAGQKGWQYKDIFLEIRNLSAQGGSASGGQIGDRIKVLGYYPGEKLPQLLQNASVFVYPPLYEGFGLPVLEAMAAGVPVVTSKGTSMEEIVISPTPRLPLGAPFPISERGRSKVQVSALLVNPYSAEEIGAAITRLIRDQSLARQMSEAGIKRARKLTWQRTAKRTLETYWGLTP